MCVVSVHVCLLMHVVMFRCCSVHMCDVCVLSVHRWFVYTCMYDVYKCYSIWMCVYVYLWCMCVISVYVWFVYTLWYKQIL